MILKREQSLNRDLRRRQFSLSISGHPPAACRSPFAGCGAGQASTRSATGRRPCGRLRPARLPLLALTGWQLLSSALPLAPAACLLQTPLAAHLPAMAGLRADAPRRCHQRAGSRSAAARQRSARNAVPRPAAQGRWHGPPLLAMTRQGKPCAAGRMCRPLRQGAKAGAGRCGPSSRRAESVPMLASAFSAHQKSEQTLSLDLRRRHFFPFIPQARHPQGPATACLTSRAKPARHDAALPQEIGRAHV